MTNTFKKCTSMIEDFNSISSLKKIPSQPTFISEEDVVLNYKLLKEELEEYVAACKEKNMIELFDSAGDMFFVLWGIISKHGLQDIFLEKILLPICVSNKTKTCETLTEARASVKAYQKKGINVKFIEVNGVYGIFNVETMKLLKGVNYKEPEFKI